MVNRVAAIGCAAVVAVAFTAPVPTAAVQAGAQSNAPAGVKAPVPTQTGAAAQRALVDRYCVGCHNQRAKAAGQEPARKITLDDLDIARVSDHADAWERVVRKMRAGMMPPAGARRPDKATYEGLITWLEGELDRNAAPYTPPPGLHRLNRTEYANVIHDLLSLDIDAGSYLPSDDSTHGFDNMAGALGISSTLIEAYVSAAGKISRLAIGEPATPGLVVYRTPEDTSQDYHIEGLPFGTRGGMLVKHVFPSDGEYSITVTPIFGDNMSPTGFGSVPCEKLEILLDGARVQLVDWQGSRRFGAPADGCGGAAGQPAGGRGRGAAPAAGGGRGRGAPSGGGQQGPEAFFGGRGGTPMRARVKVTAGPHAIGATFLATNLAPLLDLDQHFMRDTLQTGPTPGFTFFPHVGTVRIEGPFNAAPATESPSRRKIFVCHPGTADPAAGPPASRAASKDEESACARKIVGGLAAHAFRRPVSAPELQSLMAFYDGGRKESDFEHGVEIALARILADPRFLYRIETEPAAVKPGQIYRVSDFDLASRLSFFLWSTAPDDELVTLAGQGRLKDPAVLEKQVRRLLADPRAEALAVNFAGQWLNLRGMQSAGPLPLVYPDFDDPLRQSMRREVELLFDSIVREDRSVLDLLTADYTFVNERLAKHYGIPNVYGSQFRRVTLGPDMDVRRGLLGKGAFLTTTSKPERTSPVTRGKWVMTNILGMSPPDPPPDVPPLKPRTSDAAGNATEPTMRQKMLDHRVRADCAQCHSLMDPIGFSLENFDGIGLWRSHDEGTAVDAAAQVFDGTKIDGPAGLRNWLASYRTQFTEVAAEKLLTYALGRGVEYQDMPLVRAITRDTDRNGGRFSALVLGVVTSKPFQMNVKARDAATPTTADAASADARKGAR
jgi:mono/diheme cytochrome c family protein